MMVGMDKGKGEQGQEDKDKTRQGEWKRIVVVQWACESLHSRESHTEMRGMRLQLPSILIY